MSENTDAEINVTLFSEELLKKVISLPTNELTKLNDFINDNREIIAQIVSYQVKAKGEWKLIKGKKENLLKQTGSELYQSGGNANFIAKIPGTELVIKIAGDVSLLYNLGISLLNKNFYDPKIPPTQEDIKKIYDYINSLDESHYTFQSIGRLVRTQSVKQAQIPGVKIPETYLVYFQSDKNIVSDQTYLVVQKYIDTKGLTFFNDKNIQSFIMMPNKFFSH